MESGYRGVTVGAIVGPEGILCIDAPTHAGEARKWRQKLEQLSEARPRFVINLDHDLDRVLGNPWLEAPVIASEAAAERIRAYPEVYRSSSSAAGADSDAADDLHGVRIVSPTLIFSDRLTLYSGKREVHLLRTPGPNPAAVWAHLPEDRIVFVGDSVAVDAPPVFAEADTGAWLASLEALKRAPYKNHKIVPGRGRATDAGELHWLITFLKEARRKVARLAAHGEEKPSVAKLVPEFLEYWEVPRAEQSRMRLRLQAGLERLWDEAAHAE